MAWIQKPKYDNWDEPANGGHARWSPGPRKGLNAAPFRRILNYLVMVISTMLVFSLDLHHVPDSSCSRYQSSAFPVVT